MKILAIIIGKLIIKLLNLFGYSASALPGLVIEKLYPKLIEDQLSLIKHGTVVVSGTNGKTTTTKAITYLLKNSGLRVLTNPTGSNFTRGVYSTIVRNSKITGGIDYDVAVFELDEAYSRKFVNIYSPDHVLILNIMRDQLDRYGEIDTTKEMLQETANSARKSLVLYADDNRVREIAKSKEGDVYFYGSASKLMDRFPSDDELFKVSGKTAKGKRNSRSIKRKDLYVELFDYENKQAVYKINHKRYPVELKIEGAHNALNLAGALAVVLQTFPQMKPQYLVPLLRDFESAFGRGESIKVDGKTIYLSLVKNPSGFRQSLESFKDLDFDTGLLAINDDFADGRDVSWLWDVTYKPALQGKRVLTTGTRAYDMTLRLKYDDIEVVNTDKLINDSIANLLERTKSTAVIFCTYTAMLEIRKKLKNNKNAMGDVWENN